MSNLPSTDYGALAADYARHRQVHPGVLKDLLETGGVTPTSRVLEVGCGTGNYSIALQALAGCAAWGIDPSDQMLARARARSQVVTFQPGRAENLDFPPASFDLVFSVDVIHHVGDRRAYFQGAHRMLRDGGRFCTVTDSEWIILHRQPLTTYFPESAEADLRRYPPIADLRDLMAVAGFEGIVERTVELDYELADAGPYRDRAFSSLHLISEEVFRRGLERLERDLAAGPVQCASRYLVLWGERRTETKKFDTHSTRG